MEHVKKVAFNSIGPIIQPNLQSIIRELRSNSEKAEKIVDRCVYNSRIELDQGTIEQKATALQKLMYLHMMGYDMSWAAFNSLEVMASTIYSCKKIGYSAACQFLPNQPSTLILIVNTCKKDLKSSYWNSTLALNAIAHFISSSPQTNEAACHLAKQFTDDICFLMQCSKANVRQKAIMVCVHLLKRLPNDTNLLECLCQRLTDSSHSVQSSCVSALCELSSIPSIVQLLSPSTKKQLESIFQQKHEVSNWLLIKLVKLTCSILQQFDFLMNSLTDIIQHTTSTSLLYECIDGLVLLLKKQDRSPSDIELCARKLAILVEDSDQNLRYLGLQAMFQLYQGRKDEQFPHFPRNNYLITNRILFRIFYSFLSNVSVMNVSFALSVQGDADDQDDSIRHKAILLLPYAVTNRSLSYIVEKLSKCPQTILVTSTIIEICKWNNYERVSSNFSWYLKTLTQLASNCNDENGKILAEEFNYLIDNFDRMKDEIIANLATLVDCPSQHVRSTAAYLVGNFSKSSNDYMLLMKADRQCSELPYALLKMYCKLVQSADLIPFRERLNELFRRSFYEKDSLQLAERSQELLFIDFNDDLLVGEELSKIFDDNSRCSQRPALPTIFEQPSVEIQQHAKYETMSFKYPIVSEENVSYQLELRQKQNRLIVHIKLNDISSSEKVGASPNPNFADQLFLIFNKTKRKSNQSVSMYYRVTSVNLPQKLSIDIFRNLTKIQTLNLTINVSNFLLPFYDNFDQLNYSTQIHIGKNCDLKINQIFDSIPALYKVSESFATAQTLMGHKISIKASNDNLKIESDNADFIHSLSDDIREITS